MALFCVISANSGSFRAHCVKVHVRYLISRWVLIILFWHMESGKNYTIVQWFTTSEKCRRTTIWNAFSWSPCAADADIIFLSCFFFLLLFYSSFNLSRRILDVYHTSTHGVALMRIYDAGPKRAARGSLKYRTQKIKSPTRMLANAKRDGRPQKCIYTVSHKNGANLVLSVTSSNINKF